VRLLVVNAGSSSLKLRLLDDHDNVLASSDDADVDVQAFMQDAGGADAAVHRVVHGGDRFTSAVAIDASVEATLEELADLAPLHNPVALKYIRTLDGLVPQVACFDTAFHATLPPAAFTYAVPGDWGVRRFGFHGLSHAYASRTAAEQLGRPLDHLRLVTAHLGSGASLCAVLNGRSVDTTMGFTPMEGLVMGTRSGTVDPGLLLWVQQHHGLSASDMERVLDRESGLLALVGTADMRMVLESAKAGDESAQLAIDVYIHRLVGLVAAMAASMGGLDALVFTGGVGEHAEPVRHQAVAKLEFLGPFDVVVVEAREDLEMARQARPLLTGRPAER
jgi:acetate kinase